MRRVLVGIVVLVVHLPVAPAQDKGQDKSATPSEQYQTLLKEYQAAASGGVLSDEERLKFVGHAYKLQHKLVRRSFRPERSLSRWIPTT